MLWLLLELATEVQHAVATAVLRFMRPAKPFKRNLDVQVGTNLEKCLFLCNY